MLSTVRWFYFRLFVVYSVICNMILVWVLHIDYMFNNFGNFSWIKAHESEKLCVSQTKQTIFFPIWRFIILKSSDTFRITIFLNQINPCIRKSSFLHLGKYRIPHQWIAKDANFLESIKFRIMENSPREDAYMWEKLGVAWMLLTVSEKLKCNCTLCSQSIKELHSKDFEFFFQ